MELRVVGWLELLEHDAKEERVLKGSRPGEARLLECRELS
jgi:hypothetical protein